MRSFIIAACLALVGYCAYAQAPPIPKTTELTNDASYKKYEPQFLAVEKWLENSPIDKDAAKRKEASTFLMAWLSGVPYVTLTTRDEIMPFSQTNGDLVIYLLGGWARYMLEHPNDKSEANAIAAGLKSVIKVYKANASVKRDEHIDKLVKMADKGTLESWVAKQIK